MGGDSVGVAAYLFAILKKVTALKRPSRAMHLGRLKCCPRRRGMTIIGTNRMHRFAVMSTTANGQLLSNGPKCATSST